MRLIKAFGLATLAALVLTGLIGTSSASAANTQLCTSHTGLTCAAGQAATTDHQTLAPNTSWVLLTNLVNVLCLWALKLSTALGLANPQLLHTLELNVLQCGTDKDHDNCEVTVNELPLLTLNKTGLDQGVLTATNGRITVLCDNIDIFGIDIDCEYDLTGMQLTMSSQHSTALEEPLFRIGGTLCPDESFLDLLLVHTNNRYILA